MYRHWHSSEAHKMIMLYGHFGALDECQKWIKVSMPYIFTAMNVRAYIINEISRVMAGK